MEFLLESLILLFIVAGLVGAGLVVLGLRGRLEGTDPHCYACGYNLTGLTRERCPECVTFVSASGIVHGVRVRSRRPMVGGAVLILCASAVLGPAGYRSLRSGDWYAAYPFFVVLPLAGSGSVRALGELERRLAAAELSESQMAKLAEECLRLQPLDPAPPELKRWIAMLDRLDVAGVLSEGQQERYYSQMISLSVEVRPQIRVGDPLPYSVTRKCRGPEGVGVECGYRCQGVRVGEVELRGAWSSTPGADVSSGSFGTRCELGRMEPNTYGVTIVLHRRVARNQVVLFADDVVFTAETTVLSPDAVPQEILIVDPDLRARLEGMIRVRQAELLMLDRRSRSSDGTVLSILFWVLSVSIGLDAPLPVDVAFDVVALDGGREIVLGTVVGMKGTTSGWSFSVEDPKLDEEQVTLILRSNPELVWGTVDQLRCWDGELTLGPVELRRR